MDTALTPVVPANAAAERAAAPTGAFGRLAALPARSKTLLGVGVAGLLAVVVSLVLWSQQGDWKVLYANLSDKDAGAVLAQLSQMNVPYKHAEGGSALLIPADKVHDVRLKLAQAGLPKGGTSGFELMDNARFGQTQFQERLTFQRGLEGELVRSIGSLAAVQSARVHLALPQQNGFFREQQKPSASVLLTLHPGRLLDRAQIAGIVHLVSSSVPELSPKAVSVLDSSGALLSENDESSAQRLDAQQLHYVKQIEQDYQKRVMEILEPVVGRDNLRANVTAEVDFSQSEATSEAYKPNQGSEPAAVRSLQNVEATTPGTPTPAGVPGAASNQPPVPATAPLQGASAPLQGAQGGLNGGSARKENVTNYEVDKTVRVVRNATGTVKRLNAAVVVNHKSSTDAKGKTSSQPLTDDEINKLTALVQESIGFSKERGDSVKVINAPFRADAAPKPEAVPLWQQPWVLDLLRVVGVPLALAVVALALVFGVIRPALKPPVPPAGEEDKKDADGKPQLSAVVDDPVALPGSAEALALEAPKPNKQLEDARALAKENPQAVANILRGWVNGDEA
ncbi:flagellar basal-body M-ring protein/flagellar hook-basal body protein FliF [Burkholderiales bacterium JOSHI_001]|nr:flagellar basal-body M-ring protein/flagellar hook-basal body protein FliF [Burkholderiales bacterium JOSHI_001]